MFKGFNIKYPEYEVITPQTLQSFTVRTLNVMDEERLKGSLLTPTKITDHLNKCLYESLVTKPPEITDFKSFLQRVSLKDRDALLYGLYHITYEEIRNYDIKCPQCKKDYPVTIKASDTFSITPYETGANIFEKRIRVALPKSPGVTAIIRQPNMEDESNALKNLAGTVGYTVEAVIETLIIDKFEQDIEQMLEPNTITDRRDIIDAYRSLPAKDKRVIYEQYQEEFGKYSIALKMKSFCPSCGAEDLVSIDLVENFFRMVYAS